MGAVCVIRGVCTEQLIEFKCREIDDVAVIYSRCDGVVVLNYGKFYIRLYTYIIITTIC